MLGKRFTRALVVTTTASLVLAAAAFAETTIHTGDVAVVGDASATPGATLVRGGSSTFSLSITANDGNIPDNVNQCDGVRNAVTVPTSFTVTATGLEAGAGTETKTFNCQNFSSSNTQTLTFSGIPLTAGATAALGASSHAITFGASNAMVILGSQVQLDAAFIAPSLYVTVNPRPASNLAANAVSTSQIDLTWTASPDAADISGYVIAQTGGSSATLNALANATSLSVTGLNDSTEYCFTILARFTASSVNYDSAIAPASGTVCATTLTPVATTTMTGFYAPVKAENKAKAGQAIALKWELWNGATEVTDTAGVSVKFMTITCGDVTDPTTLGTDAADDAGTSGLRYDTTDGQFVFAWKTSKSFTGCVRAQVVKDNTVLGYADFQFTK
jgi:hypothetical protein